MGFNNLGHPKVFARLADRDERGGIVGVNLGANKDSDDRIADYALGAAVFNKLASYITVNISSPNTPGLRALQSRQELETLIGRVREAIDGAAQADGRRAPLVLKIAPDLVEDELHDIAAVCLEQKVDAIIVSNTTISRPPLKSKHKGETGGLSGAPLFRLSTVQLARMHAMTDGKLALIGVGGIASAEDAWQKLRAGASLLQLYSALVYQGPQLIADILQGLIDRMDEHGFSGAARGHRQWSRRVGQRRAASVTRPANGFDQTLPRTTVWRCEPRPSTPSSMTSPGFTNTGGFMPRPTPAGVPVMTMSPGSSVMNRDR